MRPFGSVMWRLEWSRIFKHPTLYETDKKLWPKLNMLTLNCPLMESSIQTVQDSELRMCNVREKLIWTCCLWFLLFLCGLLWFKFQDISWCLPYGPGAWDPGVNAGCCLLKHTGFAEWLLAGGYASRVIPFQSYALWPAATFQVNEWIEPFSQLCLNTSELDRFI